MNGYIDMHCDTLQSTVKYGADNIYRVPQADLDVERLRQAGAAAQFFAVFFPPRGDRRLAAFQTDDEFFDALYRTFRNTLERHGDVIRYAGNYGDICRNRDEHRISALLTLEDGRILDGSMEKLRIFYEKGVRLITLTWNHENCLGFPNSRDPELMRKGLKEFGREAVREMNRLGILIDVSHLSDGGFTDVARVSGKPFVASHSNCRALCPHPRNLTDEMIRTLAEAGGAAGLNLYGAFLNEDPADETSRIERMAAHVMHLLRVGGEDVPAIGTDFDGISGALEIADPTQLQKLFDALLHAGMTQRQLDKFLSGNVLRVIRDVL